MVAMEGLKMVIIDLSHTLDDKTPTYPGTNEKPPLFEQTASVEQNGYANWNLTTGLHIGTHIDAPSHMLINANTIDDIPLKQLCCTAHLIDARKTTIIDANLIESIFCKTGDALLIYTGYDRYYAQPEYFEQHPVLTKQAAHAIITKKIGLVGLDTPSPDRFPFAIHKLLFSHNIVIIENLTRVQKLLGADHIMLFALPLKCKTDGAPARVVAVLED
jgi:kynurenine formamidase